MYTTEEITTREGFLGLEPVWNALLEKNDIQAPFLAFEWLASWWTSFGQGRRMLVIVVRRDGVPAALAPLMISRSTWRWFPVRALTFMADELSSRNGFILADDDPVLGERIFAHLNRASDRFDTMLFDLVVEGSRTDRILQAVLGGGTFRHAKMESYVSPYLTITGSWDDYLRSRSRSFRARLKYIPSLLGRTGPHEVTVYTTGDTDRAMEELLQVSRRTWKFREGTALASTPQATEFIRDFSRRAAQRGWLNLRILRLNGRPVAFHYGLDFLGKNFFYKTGFDEEFKKLSLGQYLVHEALREAFEKNQREFDFLGKDEPYKLSFTSTLRTHHKVVIFKNTPYGKLLCSGENAVLPFLRKLREKSAAAVTWLRTRVPGLLAAVLVQLDGRD